MDFRDYLFSSTYIALNAGKFLDDTWVNVGLFREYVQQMAQTSTVDASRTHSPSVPDSTHIKIEAPPPVLPLSVKAEPETISLRQPPQSGDVKMRVLTEDGHEVLELLSDSDEDEDLNSDQEVIEALRRTSRSSSILAPSIPDSTAYDDIDSVFGGEPSYDDQNSSQLTDDDSSAVDSFPLVESNTVWEDGSKSFVRDTGIFHPIRGVTVERMEYRDGPAFVYPMHCTRTGLVVDMSHQKYNFCHPTTKDLYTVNVVIQNSDNDGWETNGGGGKASVVFASGEAPLDCKSFRFMCKGATACDKLDPALRSDIRFELDPVSRDAVIAAQQETRRREGNTNEERATMFMTIIQRAKCIAIDSKGVKCKSGPGISNGHQYFVACSGWTKQFKDNHRTHTIPDHVDEHLLIKALAGQPLTDDKTKDTPPCSAIIHPHIGLKKKKCAASILRAFVTGASADFFEFLFDEIQRIKLSFTRKPLQFKTFIRGGNLHVTNVDMDGAQVIGLTRSVLKYSDPEYSGIPLDTPPEKVAPKFIKVCWRHAKEPIHDFRSLVSTSDFNRLKNCFYIEDKEALDAFSAFVYGLRIKKITDWWKHKEMHEWIIPCMVKSQSGISAETWDATPSTTNTNEGLHAWTNSLAGIKLTPVEALESRRKIDSDRDVSREIKMSLSTGILANPNNEMSHRMARDSQRRSAATQKTRDSHAAADLVKDLRLQIEEAAAHTKALKAELKATKASSSGRVRTAPARTAARTNAPAIQSSIPTAASSSSPALDMSTLPLSPIPALDMMSTAPPIPIPTLEPSLIPIPVPEMLTAPSIPIPTLEPWMTEFDSFSFSPDFDLSFLGGVPNTMDAFLGFDMGPSLPFSGTPVTYPGFTASFDGQDATVNPSNFGSLAAFDPLPLLPPLPPPDSPPAMALTAASEAPKSRRHRQEVNEADILPENSKRTRAPSTRKRSAEEDVIPDQLPKKGKRNT
ncbi:hypothetical protein K438DRAFT_1981666 [Mycena galopus ATCC 62051]|nr:hypothetical protein K438DRAFT_1981666 [Mycena galopus ATCC 62051]